MESVVLFSELALRDGVIVETFDFNKLSDVLRVCRTVSSLTDLLSDVVGLDFSLIREFYVSNRACEFLRLLVDSEVIQLDGTNSIRRKASIEVISRYIADSHVALEFVAPRVPMARPITVSEIVTNFAFRPPKVLFGYGVSVNSFDGVITNAMRSACQIAHDVIVADIRFEHDIHPCDETIICNDPSVPIPVPTSFVSTIGLMYLGFFPQLPVFNFVYSLPIFSVADIIRGRMTMEHGIIGSPFLLIDSSTPSVALIPTTDVYFNPFSTLNVVGFGNAAGRRGYFDRFWGMSIYTTGSMHYPFVVRMAQTTYRLKLSPMFGMIVSRLIEVSKQKSDGHLTMTFDYKLYIPELCDGEDIHYNPFIIEWFNRLMTDHRFVLDRSKRQGLQMYVQPYLSLFLTDLLGYSPVLEVAERSNAVQDLDLAMPSAVRWAQNQLAQYPNNRFITKEQRRVYQSTQGGGHETSRPPAQQHRYGGGQQTPHPSARPKAVPKAKAKPSVGPKVAPLFERAPWPKRK